MDNLVTPCVVNYEELHKVRLSYGWKPLENKYDCLNVLLNNVDANYLMAYGGRSIGKTYSAMAIVLLIKCVYGLPSVYIRRNDTDIYGSNMCSLISAHLENGSIYRDLVIDRLFPDFDEDLQIIDVSYKQRFVCINVKDLSSGKLVQSERVFYPCSLSCWEKYKGVEIRGCEFIVFDEYLSREGYLRDEFYLLTQLMSTFFRSRLGKVVMCSNTVSMINPYDEQMGLSHKSLSLGEIKVFEKHGRDFIILNRCKDYGLDNEELFDFSNKKLRMITHGDWETGEYVIGLPSDDVSKLFVVEFRTSDYVFYCEVSVDNTKGLVGYCTSKREEPNFTILPANAFALGTKEFIGLRTRNARVNSLLKSVVDNNKVIFDALETGEMYMNFFGKSF